MLTMTRACQMTSSGDPWSHIPTHRFAVRVERRADPEHPVDFYRARSTDGGYLFLLKNISRLQPTTTPVLRGVNVGFEKKPDGTSELILELVDNEQISLFRALTQDFLNVTADLSETSSDIAAQRVMIRLERWQMLLRRQRTGVLSRQAIIGLVGELLFLRDKLLPTLGVEKALLAWRGPYRDEQDFAVTDYIIEIKTQLSTADQYLLISSESQLDDSSGKIAVCHQTLVSSPDHDEGAWTLNQLVEDLRGRCLAHSLIAHDLLDAGLLGAGYQTRSEYDEENWKPVIFRIFEVVDDFPRLVPAQLPAGVSNVRYRITLGVCDRFERTPDWLDGVILGRG